MFITPQVSHAETRQKSPRHDSHVNHIFLAPPAPPLLTRRPHHPASPVEYYRFPTSIHPDLGELLEDRWKKIPYGSRNAYITGLIIFDLMAQRDHRVTRPLMDSPTRVRDAFIAELKEKYRAGIRMDDSGWAEKLFQKLVAEEVARIEQERLQAEAEKETAPPATPKQKRPAKAKPKS